MLNTNALAAGTLCAPRLDLPLLQPKFRTALPLFTRRFFRTQVRRALACSSIARGTSSCAVAAPIYAASVARRSSGLQALSRRATNPAR